MDRLASRFLRNFRDFRGRKSMRSNYERLGGQCGRAAIATGLAVDEMAFGVENVVQTGADRGKFLQRFHLPKSLQCPLPSAQWQVRIFGPIIEVPPHLAPVRIAQFTHRSRVGAKSIDWVTVQASGRLMSCRVRTFKLAETGLAATVPYPASDESISLSKLRSLALSILPVAPSGMASMKM